MFNHKNIDLFNYVYSAGFLQSKEDDVKWTEFEKLCKDKVDYLPYDFIVDYKQYLNMNSNHMWQDLSGNKTTTGKFVTLNHYGVDGYIDYKKKQIKSIVDAHGKEFYNHLNKFFENMCNDAIKDILVECRYEGMLEFSDNIFVKSSGKIYEIIYSDIKIKNGNDTASSSSTININNTGTIVSQLGDHNSANINQVPNEDLFNLLNEKLDAIKAEMKDKNCESELAALEEAIKAKDRKRTLKILKFLLEAGCLIASAIFKLSNSNI